MSKLIKTLTLLSLVVFFIPALIPNPSFAETKRACVRTANTNHNLCTKDCNSTHEDDLLICAAGSDEDLKKCYQGCSTDRDACIEPYQDNNRTCHDACFTTYDASITSCTANECQQGNLQCQICKLTAKLVRFECAKVCQDTFNDTKDERAACRKTFRKCLKTCRNS